jgi:hypothetical protein
MRSIALVTAYALLILSGVRTMQAMGKKDPNSSTLATPPVYDLTGTLGGNLLGSYHSSATDADGNIDSWWCDSTNSSVDCHEGTGLIHWVDLTDGRRVQYGCERCLTVDLDHSDGAFGFAIVSAVDDPWSFLNANHQVLHLRIRAVAHIGVVENYVCMPILHLPAFQDGKNREAYAKHHSMEACQLFSGDFSTHPPTQASVLPEATGQALITNSAAGKSSPAAAAAMAEVGHIQTPEEMAGQVQAGQASKCAVITNPPGAEIDIDGNKAGVSPMVFVLLKKGDTPRVITIRMSGYKTVEKSVVPDGKTIPLGLILEKEAQ